MQLDKLSFQHPNTTNILPLVQHNHGKTSVQHVQRAGLDDGDHAKEKHLPKPMRIQAVPRQSQSERVVGIEFPRVMDVHVRQGAGAGRGDVAYDWTMGVSGIGPPRHEGDLSSRLL